MGCKLKKVPFVLTNIILGDPGADSGGDSGRNSALGLRGWTNIYSVSNSFIILGKKTTEIRTKKSGTVPL